MHPPSFISSRPFNVSPKIMGTGFFLSKWPTTSRTTASTSEKSLAKKKLAKVATAKPQRSILHQQLQKSDLLRHGGQIHCSQPIQCVRCRVGHLFFFKESFVFSTFLRLGTEEQGVATWFIDPRTINMTSCTKRLVLSQIRS